MAGEAAVDAWLAALQLIVLSTRSTAVIVGATGGVRLALERGQLTNDMLAAFAARVEKLGGARCQFLLLSGEDEAAARPSRKTPPWCLAHAVPTLNAVASSRAAL